MDSEAMAEPEFSLLSLPDDPLLAVLAFLSPRELFVCRVACRRLRDLCLHRQLWRAATVKGKGVLRAALALAPCIGTIASVPIEALEPLVCATACTVSGLALRVWNKEQAALALALLGRFSAVSSGLRLRKLSLNFGAWLPAETRQLLFKAVYAFNGLQDLTFNHCFDQELDSAARSELKVLPSLTRLRYTSSSKDAFLELMLETHSATLEDVDLGALKDADVPWSSLASLSRLRSLTCTQGEGLSHLAALPIVELIFVENDDAFAPGALEFLLNALHLRTVKLFATLDAIDDPLLALGNSRSAPTVETLDVDYNYKYFYTDEHGDVSGIVASVLPKFPSLKCLVLTLVGDELPEVILQAVSPTSSPCLTMLELYKNYGIHDSETPYQNYDIHDSETPCLHAALHGPFVLDVLVRNPRLHLRVTDCTFYYCKSCPWCRWGCHARLGSKAVVSLSSHTLRAGCPLDCYQAIRSSDRPYAAGKKILHLINRVCFWN